MPYTLIAEKTEHNKAVRVYQNTITFGEIKTSHIYTDNEGGKWWGFQDLFKVPIMRSAMARSIIDLFTVGLSLKDILQWCEQEKVLLKSDDPEKYEKLYKLILEKEQLANYTADPLKQSLALATVYILADDEKIDYFDSQKSEAKLKLWAGDMDMTAFFLSWQRDHTVNFMKDLKTISKTVSKLENKNNQLAQLKP